VQKDLSPLRMATPNLPQRLCRGKDGSSLDQILKEEIVRAFFRNLVFDLKTEQFQSLVNADVVVTRRV